MTRAPPRHPRRGINPVEVAPPRARSPPHPTAAGAVVDKVKPDDRVVGRQRWRDLLFLHQAISVERLRPLVPAPLAIDTFDGQAWVTLIPFTILASRPIGAPGPLGLDFLEINLRTYVRSPARESGNLFLLPRRLVLACGGRRATCVRAPVLSGGDGFAQGRRRNDLLSIDEAGRPPRDAGRELAPGRASGNREPGNAGSLPDRAVRPVRLARPALVSGTRPPPVLSALPGIVGAEARVAARGREAAIARLSAWPGSLFAGR